MSDQSHFIGQIQQKEKDASKMLEKAEKDNNQSVLAANDEAAQIITEAEEEAKKVGTDHFRKSKEGAKGEYKRILIELDSKRRDVIEGGKSNLDKAKKHINSAFVSLFE